MCVFKRIAPQGDGSREPADLDRALMESLDGAREICDSLGKTVNIVLHPTEQKGIVALMWSSDNAIASVLEWQEGEQHA